MCLKPKISACLIVRNEEANIGTCIKSIQKVCDEIIICDTGSTDDTVRIINNYIYAGVNIKLFHKEWNDHFADMRNYSLSKATGDYIFVIDGDEVLEQWQEITDEYDFYVVKSVVLEASDKYSDTVRVFRNDSKIKYEHQRHATVDNSIKGMRGAVSKIILRHPPISKEELDAKMKHNLELHLDEKPCVTTNYNLLRCYLYLKQWDKAIEYGEKALEDDLNTQSKAVISAQLYHAYYNLGTVREDYLHLSLMYVPKQILSRIPLGILAHKNGDKEKGEAMLNMAEELNNAYLEDRVLTDFPNDRYYTTEQFNSIKTEI